MEILEVDNQAAADYIRRADLLQSLRVYRGEQTRTITITEG